jgi:hypothetical protein
MNQSLDASCFLLKQLDNKLLLLPKDDIYMCLKMDN